MTPTTRRWLSLSVLALVFAIISGCASLPTRSTNFESGSILIFPPKNVVQNGEPHPEGKDSGQYFEDALVRQINTNTTFSAESVDSNQFSYEERVDPNEAAELARERGSDYFFILELGEFLDAAAMTFRQDHVTLRSGKLYRTSDQKVVWELVRAHRLSGSNPPSYYRFLDSFAQMISSELRAVQ